ncbi:MAG: biotin--[acetyl-CoA-carboxylase] ligase [Oscillospiraceae bacterium]|nr:biotin--[acetyl-CoA-carboxylase] ligase [Oscillospiraceae bacterium]
MLKRPKSGCVHYEDFKIYAYNKVTSTNDLLVKAGKEGAKAGTVVLAKQQTAGKGSKGRSFYSPLSGLYMSVLVRPGSSVSASLNSTGRPICPELSPEDALLITPATACAVADAIQNYVYRKVGIKWVNDIYLDLRKVAGILTESCVDYAGDRFYVIGIGVNVFPPEDGFPEEFAYKTTTVLKKKYDPFDLVLLRASILDNLVVRLNQIPGRKFMQDYGRRILNLGDAVIVTPCNGDKPYLALAYGLDKDAHLVVYTANDEKVVLNSEDVSIVPTKLSNYSKIPNQHHDTNHFDISSRMKNNDAE